jgi:hypothetical protein
VEIESIATASCDGRGGWRRLCSYTEERGEEESNTAEAVSKELAIDGGDAKERAFIDPWSKDFREWEWKRHMNLHLQDPLEDLLIVPKLGESNNWKREEQNALLGQREIILF